ncbi:MAG: PAS domain S-box protein [Gemmatimonadetes bacterium]|uniref:PAS domain S-box protein n=1 Tax=Candidatus Kutchimonas denitrificans TaxID=3056748 RepID=A0AAE4Z8L5_9BACT|nr:PAS domain S-box protein [Gemmatimonadota bacterium]NIR75830.1 PAS domain S-box protein [Candidatus Kutchimonas denitrificans]NIS01997.1 PAS domain S-box protein [Gemmatimonadota bacterium]NIT67801.1 PAS domain S-box protein [Gemmatimonadota bacterium]NIU53788.1 PAS domain S-box protein [Gemmatimonadota bacterium]
MSERKEHPVSDLDIDAALRSILEGTSGETGAAFFEALVENLSRALGTEGAWVTEYVEDATELRALAFFIGGQLVPDYQYAIAGTPCEPVIKEKHFVHIPDEVVSLFPDDPDLARYSAVSYMGVPLQDLDGTVLGHLAVLDTGPMPENPRLLALFRIFADRAAAELRRLRAHARLREREEKLAGLVDGAMDAIIELDRDLSVSRVNRAAEKIFDRDADQLVGDSFARCLSDESAEKLRGLIAGLEKEPEGRRRLWISGGLEATRSSGEPFPAEASLSMYEVRQRPFYTLILRDVNERLEAERRIRFLTVKAEYLREEIEQLHGDIIGTSDALRNVLREVRQVAKTDATVLITGETGTGKELIARAIHAASPRADLPLIKVNCAAIPANLMESEFFGHEKGAFTGATARRDGRFALADRGTIFLDEVAELTPDLQAKLLRVLQEGEFEPVGSSATRAVDVRVLAATNRDLARAVEEGTFREDLYYRLNVFPITVPPLRQRDDDVVALAEFFIRRCAQKIGRSIEPLRDPDIRRLRSYPWPGNVRELENVIERAVITSRDGRLDLDATLPATDDSALRRTTVPDPLHPPSVLTERELKRLERNNILRALEATDWRVSGNQGAARLLGLKPSTLSSRMKSLGIQRPR